MEDGKGKNPTLLSRRALLSGLGAGALGLGYLYLRSGAPQSSIDCKSLRERGDERVVWHPSYAMPWYNNGYQLLLETIAAPILGEHPVNPGRYAELSNRLLEENIITPSDVMMPQLAQLPTLFEIHDKQYVEHVFGLAQNPIRGLRNSENVINSGILDFFLASVEGTYRAALASINRRVGINLSGGFHHAFPDHAEGFCFFNDIAGAIHRLRAQRTVDKILIIDLDVHHGNGNAAYFKEDPSVVIFDMYQRDIYPREKIPVEYPVELEDGTKGAEYLGKLQILEKIVQRERPDIAFYLAGADPFKGDKLGGLALTKQELEHRDRIVVATLHAQNVPTTVVLAGGYSSLADLVDINTNTVRNAIEIHT